MSSPAHGPQRPGVWAWALLAPLIGWVGLFVIVPTAVMVAFSFSQRDEIGQVVYRFTTENYARIAEGAQAEPLVVSLYATACGTAVLDVLRRGRRGGRPAFFLALFWIAVNVIVLHGPGDVDRAQWLKIAILSINYAAASTAVCVLLGYPVAYFIGQSPDRWRNVLLLLVTIPFWTSFLVRTYAWVTILREQGVLNWALLGLRVINEPFKNLYPSQTGVMIGLVYTYLPFMILPIYTSVERLDRSLVDAALDLGATPLRAFGRVILPLTMPGVVAGVVLTFVPAIGMFAVNDVLGGRQEMLIGNVIERQFTAARDKPFGAALGMVVLGAFVVTYALTLRRKPAGP